MEISPVSAEELALLEQIEKKVLWLSTYMIHHANLIRPNPDKIKVGGHQASTASVVSLVTALMVKAMAGRDRLALKPHSSPAFHSIQYLLGHLEKEKLMQFRQFGGVQSYPSRRKDVDGVHFNTGSVGLGGVNVLFGALVQEYVSHHFPREGEPGRFISLMGDAEMDEGTLYEALLEGQNHNLNNCWWILDLNRQSLDRVISLNRVGQFGEIFSSFGWEVIVLKYSRSLTRLFEQPGGHHLKQWFDDVSNPEYQTLLRVPAEEYKKQLLNVVGSKSPEAYRLIDGYDGETLRETIMLLAGHDMQMICEAFRAASLVQQRPVAILAYTVKGYGLPLAGHKDNHSGLLNLKEIEQLRERFGIAEGEELEPYAGLPEPEAVRAYLQKAPLHAAGTPPARANPPRVEVPQRLDLAYKSSVSTQGAFGQIMLALSRAKGLRERLVTTSPDVSVSTNLGGWINRVGVYQPKGRSDYFQKYHLKSPQQWRENPAGQHIELGIAENNFFSLLGVLGLSYELTGEMLFPVGTVYDVFLKRGLDMLANALYSQARFILVGTPSGVTLAPEGGAHQSFLTPLLGIGFPELHYYEPSYAAELEILMCWGLEQLQDRKNGFSSYFRLSTNPLEQPDIRFDDGMRRQVIEGGYWLRDYRAQPDYHRRQRFNILSTGVMAAQALRASDRLAEEGVYANVITLTSADRLFKGWQDYRRALMEGRRPEPPFLLRLLPPQERHPLVSLIDGHPLALEWIGGALGVPQVALGVSRFGESGDIESLYRAMHIHADDVVDAVVSLIVERERGRMAARPD
ncbi:MAG: transketolase [bacterium]